MEELGKMSVRKDDSKGEKLRVGKEVSEKKEKVSGIKRTELY